MDQFKQFIKHHKEVFPFTIFVVTTLIILIITITLTQSNQDTRSRAASGTCTVDEPLVLDSSEQEFLSILNAHRTSINKGELRASEKLTNAAQWQAEDMIENNYRSHTDSTGRSAQDRLVQCGIAGGAGENIVWSTVSAQDAFNKWINSPGHKVNMESGTYSQIGIARKSEGSTWVWVNTFSTGNDGTTPDLEDPNTPIPTATATVTPTPTSPVEPINCGTQIHTDTTTDFIPLNCAIEAANTCQSTLIGIDQTMNRLGLVTRGVTDYDFNKNLSGKCKLHFIVRLQEVLEFPSHWPDEDKEKLTSMQDELEETEGACVFNQNNDLVNFLSITKNESWTGDVDPNSPDYVFKNAQCSGSFFDTINDFILTPTSQPLPTPTLSITPNPTPPANPKTVKFSFKIPGIGGNTSLGENPYPYKGFDAIIGIIDSQEKELLDLRIAAVGFESNNYTFTSEADFDESILLPDNFIWITIPKANIHQIIIKSIPQGESLNIPTLLFRTGDFNFDNEFDLNDYIDLVSCIKGIQCFYGFEFYDLNLDRKVDVLDLNILYRAIRDFNQ